MTEFNFLESFGFTFGFISQKEMVYFGIVVAGIIVAMLFLQAFANIVINLFRSFSNLFKGNGFKQASAKEIASRITIRSEYVERKAYKLAITEEDVYQYVLQVAVKAPEVLDGIEEIVLSDVNFTDLEYRDRLFGDFDPDGSANGLGIVRIYPLRYHNHTKTYSIATSETGVTRLTYTHEEAREAQLFTLGHEFKHNEIYKNGGPLAGDAVEKECDNFSLSLRLARKPDTMGKIKLKSVVMNS